MLDYVCCMKGGKNPAYKERSTRMKSFIQKKKKGNNFVKLPLFEQQTQAIYVQTLPMGLCECVFKIFLMNICSVSDVFIMEGCCFLT